MLDLADGSLRGGANIGARFALSAISAMFGAAGSIAEAGILDIAGSCFVLHTADFKEENGIIYLPVYMTMFL